MRQAAGDGVAGAPFVIRIGEAVQKADCHRLGAARCERLDRAIEARLVERNEDIALRIDPLAHRKAQPPRHQGRWQVDVDVVLLEAVLVADFDHIAEAFGGQQRRSWRRLRSITALVASVVP